jgi:hypothetical protein
MGLLPKPFAGMSVRKKIYEDAPLESVDVYKKNEYITDIKTIITFLPYLKTHNKKLIIICGY